MGPLRDGAWLRSYIAAFCLFLFSPSLSLFVVDSPAIFNTLALFFSLSIGERNVTLAVPFGTVRVGLDEAESFVNDTWLTSPGPMVPDFDRGWSMRPREVADWVHAVRFRYGVKEAEKKIGGCTG